MSRNHAFRTTRGLNLPYTLLIIAAMVLTACLIGCSDKALVTDDSDTLSDGTSFFDLPFDESAFAKRTDVVVEDIIEVQEFLVVDEGGVILFGDTSDLETAEAFIVQAESFSPDTLFSILVTKIITVDGEMPIIYDFGPDGLAFTKPALLRINAWEDFGKNTDAVDLYWLNEETSLWEKVDTAEADPLTGNVVFELKHFSKYGTTTSTGPPDGRGGGSTMGE